MENFTHSLTGVLLARAGFNKLTPRAAWVMGLALNTPDIDVVWSMGREQYVYLDHHRGFTHSFFFSPLVALLPIAVILIADRIRAFLRPGRPKPEPFTWKTWLAALFGVVAHICQDTTNVYGVRSLWPATEHWFRLDWVNIVDVWIWLILLLGVFWPSFSKLVSGEIGSKRTPGTIWARVVLAALVAYVAVRGVMHGRAVDLVAAPAYRGHRLIRAAAFPPSPFSLFAWTGVAELNDEWRILPVDLTRDLNPDAGRTYPKILPDAAAVSTPPFQAFLRFSQFPIWTSVEAPDQPNAKVVQVCDLRFGLPGEGRFCATATVDAEKHVTPGRFQLLPSGALPRPR